MAASRVGHPDHIRFALLPDGETGEYVTRNVVFREALTYDDDGASDAGSNLEDECERNATPADMSDEEPAVLGIYRYHTGMDRFSDYKSLVLVCGLQSGLGQF